MNTNTIIATTPAGWVVRFYITDAQNARFQVDGTVTINKVAYNVHGEIRYGQVLAYPRRPEWGAPDATPSARKKAYAEIGAVMGEVKRAMSAGTVTRDAMVSEVQATIARIEANMKELAAARAELMGLAEELSELNDDDLRGAAQDHAREKISGYYERQHARYIPYYIGQLRKVLPNKPATRAKVVR